MGSKFDIPHIVMHVQHLHIIYLTIPSAADIIQHRILGRIMNNQQEKLQIGLVMTQCEGLSGICMKGLRKAMKPLTQNNEYVYHDFQLMLSEYKTGRNYT